MKERELYSERELRKSFAFQHVSFLVVQSPPASLTSPSKSFLFIFSGEISLIVHYSFIDYENPAKESFPHAPNKSSESRNLHSNFSQADVNII